LLTDDEKIYLAIVFKIKAINKLKLTVNH